MSFSLTDWIKLNQIPTGRRQVAMGQIATIAEKLGWQEIRAHCAASIEHETDLRDKRLVLSSIKRKHDPRLSNLDPRIDKLVGAIYRNAGEAASSLKDTREGDCGEQIINRIFPGGAIAITSLSYPEQNAEVGTILKLLQGDLKDEVSALGLGAYVSTLARLNDEFGKILRETKPAGVTVDQVRAANAKGQENLMTAVVMILARHISGKVEDTDRLLKPIRIQNEEIRSHIRSRRNIADIDPDTGEEAAEPEQASSSSTPPSQQEIE